MVQARASGAIVQPQFGPEMVAPVALPAPVPSDPERVRPVIPVGEDSHHPLPASVAKRVEVHVPPVLVERDAGRRVVVAVDRPPVEARLTFDLLASPLAADGAKREAGRCALPAREAKLDRLAPDAAPLLQRPERPVRGLPDHRPERQADSSAACSDVTPYARPVTEGARGGNPDVAPDARWCRPTDLCCAEGVDLKGGVLRRPRDLHGCVGVSPHLEKTRPGQLRPSWPEMCGSFYLRPLGGLGPDYRGPTS